MSWRIWLLTLSISALAACIGSEQPKSLILVSIDTLRPDKLGAYGYPRPTSPTIDGIATQGVLFEEAVSTSPWTLPAHGSLLTGLYPSRHGVKSIVYGLPVEVSTLAELLRDGGFDTAAFVNSRYLNRRYGWQRGFRQFEYIPESMHEVGPSKVEARASQWLHGELHERFFLFLHFYDVHSDYRSLPAYEEQFLRPYAGRADGSTRQLLAHNRGKLRLGRRDALHLEDLYVASIRQLDDAIAGLLRSLEAVGRLEDTLLVLTSDHGEEFLEHAGVLHGRTQYDEVMRVPLIFRGPGVPVGMRVKEPVSLIDVVPTALSLLGVTAPEGLDGVDLSGLWRGEKPGGERLLFGEADHENLQPDSTRSVRASRFKLIVNRASGTSALYDLAADPGETRDVTGEHLEVAARLRARLAEFDRTKRIGGPRKPLPDLGPQELRLLRLLGYL